MGETRFEMTSIHDVSLRDAWSKVLQGCMEMLPAVESLLLNFTEVSLCSLRREGC
jgi:Ras-related GTP-binding protein C/D